jgi:hypothetical protein
MINIIQNTDSKLILFLEEFYDYYLFVFTRNNGCEVVKNIYTAVECDFYSFIINENIAEGVWNLEVYGQDNYSNLNPENAILVFEDNLRVNNIEDAGGVFLVTQNCNYLTTENDEYLIKE